MAFVHLFLKCPLNLQIEMQTKDEFGKLGFSTTTKNIGYVSQGINVTVTLSHKDSLRKWKTVCFQLRRIDNRFT